ncbi:hypothetical protein K488DRAFT_44597 [Vararia minispora EC-137]|uniref:Uncharacterized protein n=1 Tax=Vararia minispora EC-137 TaxID=1314806 RepID=A0ACB8QSL8_9AGAM|nr:hypothetical protein K488DRAFT_44597 [Vararia minispora EC-137]
MPKREKTPPPADDEPKFLTVVHPYPRNADMNLPVDRRNVAFWLACITGSQSLLNMYFKPRVRRARLIPLPWSGHW